MTKLIYVGSAPAEIGDIAITRFGQAVTLPDTEAREKLPLLTEDEFHALGFTAEELKAFAPFGRIGVSLDEVVTPAKQSVLDKQKKGLDLWHEAKLRESGAVVLASETNKTDQEAV